MGGDHFPEKGGGNMVTYLELIKLLIDFGSFIAISLGTIVAIIAIVVTNKNK
ncbi:hypothetical protein GCM10007971_07300 [Oceanobacillus indicireducens]|uniref:Holin-like toxin n=1 Tax=Oceanobacillus indicireducens TaxID=1004261 RepID=A0A918CZQ1_9BACI|nr:hypothetical protein GCM10007971_07300 [Oceanobacillus indicireducens]